MRKFIFICLIILYTPLVTSENIRTDDLVYYLDKYLKIFTNLTEKEVLAVIKTESNFNVRCVTYEPNVNDFSYGPMQVRLKTARYMGFKEEPKKLLTWKYGLYYGMKYLSLSKKRAFRTMNYYSYLILLKRMYAIYNAGNLYWKIPGKRYINHNNVRRFIKIYSNLEVQS